MSNLFVCNNCHKHFLGNNGRTGKYTERCYHLIMTKRIYYNGNKRITNIPQYFSKHSMVKI